MNLDSYNYEIDESFQTYEFVSKGPNGRITKVVAYTEFGTVNGETAYNLGFGDVDLETGIISDMAVTEINGYICYRKGFIMAVSSKRIATIEVGGKKLIGSNGRTIIGSGKFVSVTGKGVVSTGVKNYAADPFFLKKAAEAKAEIDRVGLPKGKK